ncbi:MAG: SBBP repeat-containing protein, partial [Candidatus Kariarchaeaceae archaeon]
KGERDSIIVDISENVILSQIFNVTDRSTGIIYTRVNLTTFDPEGKTLSKIVIEEANTTINNILVDKNDNIIIAGDTGSKNLPLLRAFQSRVKGNRSAFISKYNTNLELEFGTYLGGSENETIQNVSVDSETNIIVQGHTTSNDFPVSKAFQSEYHGDGDVFITKFGPTGALNFSTYLGGNNAEVILYDCDRKEDDVFKPMRFSVIDQQPSFLTIDNDDDIIIAGWTGSDDFPTQNGVQTELSSEPYCNQYDKENYQSDDVSYGDNFVTKLDSNGTTIFSTYLGGFSTEIVKNILTDKDSNVIIGGVTSSSDFLIQKPLQMIFGGEILQPCASCEEVNLGGDIYLTKFQDDGEIIFSTFLGGGHGEDVTKMWVDSSNDIIMSGITRSTDFPVKPDTQYSKERASKMNRPESEIELFLAKIDSDGDRVIFNTYLDNITPTAMTIVKNRVVIVGGGTESFQPKNPLKSQKIEERGLPVEDVEGTLLGPPSFIIFESNGKIKRSSYILLLPKDEIDRGPDILLIVLIVIFTLIIGSVIVYETISRKAQKKLTGGPKEDLDEEIYPEKKEWL